MPNREGGGGVDWGWNSRLSTALQVDHKGIATAEAWGDHVPTCNGTVGADLVSLNCTNGVSAKVAVHITYRLAQPSQPACSIGLAAVILAVVIVCNAIKIERCFIATLWLADFQPILTVGDAVSSYLQRLDTTGIVTGPCRFKIFRNNPNAAGRTSTPQSAPPSPGKPGARCGSRAPAPAAGCSR